MKIDTYRGQSSVRRRSLSDMMQRAQDNRCVMFAPCLFWPGSGWQESCAREWSGCHDCGM